jgi:hypothetical protein
LQQISQQLHPSLTLGSREDFTKHALVCKVVRHLKRSAFALRSGVAEIFMHFSSPSANSYSIPDPILDVGFQMTGLGVASVDPYNLEAKMA